jgi:hypothetical protein
MPLAQPYQDVDPARVLVVRALRWWWLGALITLAVGAGYFLSSSSAGSTLDRSTGTIWATNPPSLLNVPSLIPEALSRMKSSESVPDSVVIVPAADHFDVYIDGATVAGAADDYATVTDTFEQTFGALVDAGLSSQADRFQATLDIAAARSEELTRMYEDLPPGNTELAALYLARLTASDDVVAEREGALADLKVQAELNYVRAEPLLSTTNEVAASRGGKFDLIVGLLFGAMVGAAVMLGLASFDKRVRSAVNIPPEVIGDIPVVECSADSLATDALIVAACSPEAGAGVRVVLLGSEPDVPDAILDAVRRRHGDVQVVAISDAQLAAVPESVPDALQGAHTIVVAVRGKATEVGLEQLVGLAQACSAQVSAVALVPSSR